MSQSLTLAERYVLAAYNNHSKNGQLPCEDIEFLKSVKAEVLLLDKKVDLVDFFNAIDRSLSIDRALRAKGQPASAFKALPERAIFAKAISNAIADQRVDPRSNKSHEPLEAHELRDTNPASDPANWVLLAEQVAIIQKAMRSVKNPTDRLILRQFFLNNCKNQKEVAKSLNVSESTVSRRLEAVFSQLRETIGNVEKIE